MNNSAIQSPFPQSWARSSNRWNKTRNKKHERMDIPTTTMALNNSGSNGERI